MDWKEKLEKFVSDVWEILKMIATWVISIALIGWIVCFFVGGGKTEKKQTETTTGYLYNADYEEGYERGHEAGEEAAAEDLTIDGVSIVDIVDLVYDHYGMTPQEAWSIIDEYNYDGTHGGITWEEYQNAIEAAVATAMYFPKVG